MVDLTRPLNPNTGYFEVFTDLPRERWFTVSEVLESVDGLTDRGHVHNVIRTLRTKQAIESRPSTHHKEYRITDHGVDELNRLT